MVAVWITGGRGRAFALPGVPLISVAGTDTCSSVPAMAVVIAGVSRAVASAWASGLAAPRTVFADPRCDLAAAITGIERGVDRRASRALSPVDPGEAACRALLGVAVDLSDGVVEIEDGTWPGDPGAGRRRRATGACGPAPP